MNNTQCEQVLKWVISGASDAEITEAVQQQWPDANVNELLAMASTRLRQAAKTNPKNILGWSMLATKMLYQKMVDIGDFSGALKAAKQLSELANQKTIRATKTEAASQLLIVKEINLEECKQRLSARIARISDDNRGLSKTRTTHRDT